MSAIIEQIHPMIAIQFPENIILGIIFYRHDNNYLTNIKGFPQNFQK